MDRPYGKWTRLHVDDRAELRLLELNAGGYCSIHLHECKSDTFVVARGKLTVRFFGKEPGGGVYLRKAIHLTPTSTPVRIHSLDIHQFWAQTDVVALELAVADEERRLDLQDIHRLSEAGTGEPRP